MKLQMKETKKSNYIILVILVVIFVFLLRR
jgi:hypothetical protein